jgi:hypothetical protein
MRLAKNCGSVTGIDNCGSNRVVANCGTCAAPQGCGLGGEANSCGGIQTGTPFGLVVKASNKCLDVPGLSTADGVALQIFGCNGGRNQQFTLNAAGPGQYTLVNVKSAKCLEIANSSATAGAAVQQNACNGSRTQVFVIRSVVGRYYKLVNSNSGLCVDAPGMADKTEVQQSTCDGADAQSWSFQ